MCASGSLKHTVDPSIAIKFPALASPGRGTKNGRYANFFHASALNDVQNDEKNCRKETPLDP